MVGQRLHSDWHTHVPKQLVCSKMKVRGRKWGLTARPLKRLWWVVLEMLTNSEPFAGSRGSRQLWNTVPREKGVFWTATAPCKLGNVWKMSGNAAVASQLAPHPGNNLHYANLWPQHYVLCFTHLLLLPTVFAEEGLMIMMVIVSVSIYVFTFSSLKCLKASTSMRFCSPEYIILSQSEYLCLL